MCLQLLFVIWLYPLYYFGAWIDSLEIYPLHLVLSLRFWVLTQYFSLSNTLPPSSKHSRITDMPLSKKNVTQAAIVAPADLKGKGKLSKWPTCRPSAQPVWHPHLRCWRFLFKHCFATSDVGRRIRAPAQRWTTPPYAIHYVEADKEPANEDDLAP